MSRSGQANVVAIFHASFHPTKGNVVDWFRTVDNSLNLVDVEFSVLPSGLHLVERDTVYFSHGPYSGVAVFRRRATASHGHRGFRLSSMGILVQDSHRPRPWLHIEALRTLADDIYTAVDARELHGNSTQDGPTTRDQGKDVLCSSDLRDKDFEPANLWFEQRLASSLSDDSVWRGWADELDVSNGRNAPSHHLPHLLRIMGLPSLTLYKFVLSRRRIMIFTLPPVEVSGILAWLASDICREHHTTPKKHSLGTPMESLFTGGALPADDDAPPRGTPRVLGMVTLSDIQRLESESAKGNGWIACTTDAIFMEKPQYYDLIIDLSTSTPSKASRPALYLTKAISPPNGKRKSVWKLESVRYTWSDVRIWNELDRLLKLNATLSKGMSLPHAHTGDDHSPGSTMWTDAFRVYEDVCLLCASLWMGAGTWRSNSKLSFSSRTQGGIAPSEWGAVQLEGDDDWSINGTHMRNLGQGIEGRKTEDDHIHVRNLGQGIEGRPCTSASGNGGPSKPTIYTPPKHSRQPSIPKANTDDIGVGAIAPSKPAAELEEQNKQTTVALLQTFHANTVFLLSKLHDIMPPISPPDTPIPSTPRYTRLPSEANIDNSADTVVLTPRDMSSLDMGVMSDLDSRFIEWLAEAEGYGGPGTGRRVVVKRGWQDLVGYVLGIR